MSVVDGATPVSSTWFGSNKVHAGLPPVASESSPPKSSSSPVLARVRKSSVVLLQELELEAGGESEPSRAVSSPKKTKKQVMSRRSSSGFPVSQQEDLSFRVTDRPNGSVIYLPQARARALEPSDPSSPSSLSISAGFPVTRPVIAHRRSEVTTPVSNGAPQAVQHCTSASGIPLPPLLRRGSARRSIVETQDSFRENIRRHKSSNKYVSTYSPREGSRVPPNNPDSGGSGSGSGGGGQHHAENRILHNMQLTLTKSRHCCIL